MLWDTVWRWRQLESSHYCSRLRAGAQGRIVPAQCPHLPHLELPLTRVGGQLGVENLATRRSRLIVRSVQLPGGASAGRKRKDVTAYGACLVLGVHLCHWPEQEGSGAVGVAQCCRNMQDRQYLQQRQGTEGPAKWVQGCQYLPAVRQCTLLVCVSTTNRS